jgi:hypothetical protein
MGDAEDADEAVDVLEAFAESIAATPAQAASGSAHASRMASGLRRR